MELEARTVADGAFVTSAKGGKRMREAGDKDQEVRNATGDRSPVR